MPAESAKACDPAALGDDIQKIVEKIAIDADLTDYEINVEKQDFTGDNFLGEMTRIKLKPVKHNRQKAINLILKKATLSPISREACPLISFYKREIFAYTNILPVFERLQDVNNIPAEERITFAKFYKGITEELKEMLIMNDLVCDGFVMRDKKTPFDYDHATLVIQKLARLHAFSFVLKEQDPELFSRLSHSLAHTANYGESVKKLTQQMSHQVLPLIKNDKNRKKYEAFAQNLGEKLEDCLDASLTEPYNIICHGDCWNNNMLFEYEDGHVTDMILVDWQMIRIASPVTDLSYMVSFSLDCDIIEAHLPDLWNLYYATLEKHLKKMGCDAAKCYPREIFDEHLKKKLVFGLVIGTCGIPMVLAEAGEAKSMDEIFNDVDQGEMRTNINDRACTQLNGIIDYLVKHQIM